MSKHSEVIFAVPEGRQRPSGYNEVATAGGLITVAGQLPHPDAVATGDFAAQFVSAVDRALEALAAGGATAKDILQLRIFVTDLHAYEVARETLAEPYRERLGGHYPPTTLVGVSELLGGAAVEIDALASARVSDARARARASEAASPDGDTTVSRLRVRLAPPDARYAGGLVPGSKAMEIFADLETEICLREGGDEGLCVAYDMVEFLAPLHVGDYVEAVAWVTSKGRTSRKIYAELHKVLGVDENGLLETLESPVIAAKASATIVVGLTSRRLAGGGA